MYQDKIMKKKTEISDTVWVTKKVGIQDCREKERSRRRIGWGGGIEPELCGRMTLSELAAHPAHLLEEGDMAGLQAAQVEDPLLGQDQVVVARLGELVPDHHQALCLQHLQLGVIHRG